MKYCDSADAQQRGVELGLERAVLRLEVEQWDFHGRALYLIVPITRGWSPCVGCGACVL